MKRIYFVLLMFASVNLFAIGNSHHIIEFGAGWENMGLSPETTWKPYSYSQGSRKEAHVILGWRYLGEQKIYYSAFGRLQYGFDWSMSGSMNLLEMNFGALGIGVYLSKPLSAYSKESRIGKWFSTFELNIVAFSIGGNLSPHSGIGNREWSNPNEQFGNQYYAFGGSYSYFQYSIPIRIQFWNELKKFGVGMFIESQALIIEKSLNIKMPVAIGYTMTAGVIFKIS